MSIAGEDGTEARCVATIVVTYNPGSELVDCLMSLRSQGDFVRIFVVDNSTQDSGRELVERLLAEGKIDVLIPSDENLGFARAVNMALRRTGNSDVFLMNPDAVLDKGCLRLLESRVKMDGDIGLLAPVVRSGPGVRTMSAGKLPTIGALFLHYSGLSRLMPNCAWLEGRYLFLDKHATDRDIEWAAGCCLYIPSVTVSSVGELSERWFMYGEDIEYCQRVTSSGLRIRLVGQAGAFHAMGTSVEQAGGVVSKMWPANTFDWYNITYRPGLLRRWLWRIVFSAGLISRSVLISMKSPSSTSARRRACRLARFGAAVWTTGPSLNPGVPARDYRAEN
ncbi:glycosyltransferase family 2 protein [Gordonia sp. ABSL11-1]|uniref:glycosyltransferase family 2 protein n=1 Tax=Gordonia sp. ABSL11-1 TaxID=3053924 RepID=UPI0033655601